MGLFLGRGSGRELEKGEGGKEGKKGLEARIA